MGVECSDYAGRHVFLVCLIAACLESENLPHEVELGALGDSVAGRTVHLMFTRHVESERNVFKAMSFLEKARNGGQLFKPDSAISKRGEEQLNYLYKNLKQAVTRYLSAPAYQSMMSHPSIEMHTSNLRRAQWTAIFVMNALMPEKEKKPLRIFDHLYHRVYDATKGMNAVRVLTSGARGKSPEWFDYLLAGLPGIIIDKIDGYLVSSFKAEHFSNSGPPEESMTTYVDEFLVPLFENNRDFVFMAGHSSWFATFVQRYAQSAEMYEDFPRGEKMKNGEMVDIELALYPDNSIAINSINFVFNQNQAATKKKVRAFPTYSTHE